MKLVFKDKQEVEVMVYHKKDSYVKFKAPIESIINWYPLSNSYDYKLAKDKNFLELKRLRSYLPTSYGISDNNSSLKKEEGNRCNLNTWYNPIVEKYNMKVIKKAEEYGITTIKDKFTQEDVDEGFDILGVMLNTMKDVSLERYKKSLSDRYLKKFNLKSKDTQVSEALQHTDASTDYTYDMLGKIYNMLVIMKKIIKVR